MIRAVSDTFLRNSNGNRYVLYLYWNDDAWNWNVNWLDNDWNANNPSAVLATLFISLPFGESFVLRADLASRRAFYRSLRFLPKGRHIDYFGVSLIPTEP